MVNAKSKRNDPYIGLLLISVIVVVFVMVGTVVLYRYKFDGGLSGLSIEWSNFGGFIGGIFGPLISLVTLFAVLKTVYMQRELLDAQQHEFKLLMIKQDEEIELARSEANRAKAQAYQTALLNVIANFTSELRIESNENLDAAREARAGSDSILGGVYTEHSYKTKADVLRKKIAALGVLALTLSINEFNNIDEIQSKFVAEMLEILNL